MSTEFTFRIIGMFIAAAGGIYLGSYLGNALGNLADLYAIVIGLVGALAGLILTPFLTIRPIRALRTTLGRTSADTFFASLVGLITGLIIAALLAFPISLLPPPLGQYVKAK